MPPSQPTVAWILGLDGLPGHIDPEAVAVHSVDGSRTYRELRERALALAGRLRAEGLAPGDRVATFLFNRGEIFELYFACAYAGLTLVPVNFRLAPREIAFILEDSSARVLVTQDELAKSASAAIDLLPGTDARPATVVLEDSASGAAYEAWVDHAPLVGVASTAIQLILYTSGTTGRPKGVMMAHDSVMWFAFQQVAFYRDMDSSTRTLITGPMYNTAAINEQSIPTFLVGGTACIMPSRGWSPERMSGLIDQWGVTHALIYPSMMEPMLARDAEERIDMTSMSFVLTGGENCPPAVMSRFRKRWDHIWLAIAYGSTESGVVTIIGDDEIERHPGSVGRVSGGQLLSIRNAEGVPVRAGEVGEVWTAGPAITRGYWQAPQLDQESLADGWLRMGDLGRLDEDGHLFIEGRSKDMLISKGQNIYPAEIENVLLEHPDITDAAVIGIPDPAAGEAVCACVVSSDPSLTADAVIAFVRERLASYKKPKHVVFLDELPRSPAAKVKKGDLVVTVTSRMEQG